MALVTEILFVGIITVVVGLAVTWAIKLASKHSIQLSHTSDWAYMALVLFITGTLIHIICEYTLINKWYCKHGNACQ